jgi:hypothetical protein
LPPPRQAIALDTYNEAAHQVATTDPAAFVTAVPNWSEGELITLGAGEQLRILATQPDIDEELVEQGFNGMLVVEPV